MNEISTIQMMHEILEDDSKKFQTKFSDGVIWEVNSINGCIRCTFGKGKGTEQRDFLSTDSNTMSRKWTLIKDPYRDFCTATDFINLAIEIKPNQTMIVKTEKGFSEEKRHFSRYSPEGNYFHVCPDGKSMFTTDVMDQLEEWDLAKLV